MCVYSYFYFHHNMYVCVVSRSIFLVIDMVELVSKSCFNHLINSCEHICRLIRSLMEEIREPAHRYLTLPWIFFQEQNKLTLINLDHILVSDEKNQWNTITREGRYLIPENTKNISHISGQKQKNQRICVTNQQNKDCEDISWY